MIHGNSPGFSSIQPDSAFGYAGSKLRGIILSEHAPNENGQRWFAGPTYDVVLYRDKSILESVPYYGSASGTTDIILQRLQTSSATNLEKVNAAQSGRGKFPAFDDLEGAGVLVEFDDDGMPFIRTCFPRTVTHASKIPNGRKTVRSDTDIRPDSLDELADRIAQNPAVKDSLYSTATYSTMWIAEEKYIGNDYQGVPYPPQIADTQEKKNSWIHAWLVAWRTSFANTFWTHAFDPSDEAARNTAFQNSGLGDDDEDTPIRKDAWDNGVRRGDADAQTELAVRPPPAIPDNTGAVIPENPTSGDAADRDVEDWEQVAVTGDKSAFYMEKRGVRVCVNYDGSFCLDTRSSGQTIHIQGGDLGVKVVSNGAVVDIGTGNDSTVRVTADKINLGTLDGCQIDMGVLDSMINSGVMWEPLKTILLALKSAIESHLHQVAIPAIEVIAGMTAPTTVSSAATTTTVTVDDTPKSANVRLT